MDDLEKIVGGLAEALADKATVEIAKFIDDKIVRPLQKENADLKLDNRRLTEGILSDHDPEVSFVSYPVDMADWMEADLKKLRHVAEENIRQAKSVMQKDGLEQSLSYMRMKSFVETVAAQSTLYETLKEDANG